MPMQNPYSDLPAVYAELVDATKYAEHIYQRDVLMFHLFVISSPGHPRPYIVQHVSAYTHLLGPSVDPLHLRKFT